MKRSVLGILLTATALLPGCGSNRSVSSGREEASGRYVSAFPSDDRQGAPERIARTIKKIYSVTGYTTYQFRREARVTWRSIRQGNWQRAAWGVVTTSETVSGTATVVGCGNGMVTLLTCAHIVTAPDTMVSYFEPNDMDPTQYLQSLSVKNKQEHWVKDLSGCGSFRVLASDEAGDIAVIGKRCETVSDTITVIPCKVGRAAELELGSSIWIFGYPSGSLAVTRGLASPCAKRPMGEFTVDALLNKGYSGGVILAQKSGIPGLELTGMVRNVSSEREEFLKPASGQQRIPDWLPFAGDALVGTFDQIQYGLNTVIPIEAIVKFYRENRDKLIRDGCNLDLFFGQFKK